MLFLKVVHLGHSGVIQTSHFRGQGTECFAFGLMMKMLLEIHFSWVVCLHCGQTVILSTIFKAVFFLDSLLNGIMINLVL